MKGLYTLCFLEYSLYQDSAEDLPTIDPNN